MLPSVPIVEAQENTWTTLAPMPTPRSVGGTAIVNNKIYTIGGYKDDYLNTNEMYDPATNTWTTKAPMPTPRSNFATAVYQNKIYCIGGSIKNGRTTITEVYDPVLDNWETKAHIPLEGSQFYDFSIDLSANTIENKIFVIAGMANIITNEVSTLNLVFDPEDNQWTTKNSPPYTIWIHCSVSIDDTIYVISSQNQIYNATNDSWKLGVPPPEQASHSGAIATSGKEALRRIYIIGGGVGFFETTNTNQVYNPQTDAWGQAAPMPTARQSLGVAVVDDLIYAIGGSYPEYYTPTKNELANEAEYTLLTYSKKKPVNFIPHEQSAVNERYTPIGYGTQDPNYTPPTPTPNPTPELEFLTTIVLASVAILVICGLGILAYYKKRRT